MTLPRLHPWHRRAVHPAVRDWHDNQWATSIQNRLADNITRFAGSMTFVYLHIGWFAVWIIFKIEDYPFGLLTMIVSLEAIFLSAFVMLSQNRADQKRQVIADAQWRKVQEIHEHLGIDKPEQGGSPKGTA